MASILSIETATRVCSIALHVEGQLMADQTYHLDKSHSALLPVIIQQMLENAAINAHELDAIAVSCGPGSYTGLRIGVTTAKSMAYALQCQLIGVQTLSVLHRKVFPILGEVIYVPMIDARRMEVYCQLYRGSEMLWDNTALIVEHDSFSSYIKEPIYLFGDGSAKTREILTQENIYWLSDIHPSAIQVGEIATEKFMRAEFEDIAYFEPFYLKDFQTKPAKKLI